MGSDEQTQRLWNREVSTAIESGDLDTLLHAVRYQKTSSPSHLFCAIDELRKARDKRAFDAVRLFVRSEDEVLRTAAAMYYGAIGDAEACSDMQLLTRDSAPETRAAALAAVSSIGCPDATRLLRTGLIDTSVWVRRAAATGLATIGDTSSIYAIGKAKRQEPLIGGARRAMTEAIANLKLQLNHDPALGTPP